MSFIEREEIVFALIEGMFAEVFPLAGIPITTPFPRMRWQEAMDRFGIDRPDTRFGMELIDITAAAKAIDFAAFRQAETVAPSSFPAARLCRASASTT